MNIFHKHTPVFSFVFISLIIVIFFSLFHWFNIKDKKDKLSYLPLPGWSQPVELVPNLYSKKFSVIPEDNSFTLFWLKKEFNSNKEKLIVQKNNYKGKLLKEKLLITDFALNSFTVEKVNGNYHLLYFSGKSEETQVLKHKILDSNFTTLKERIINKGLSYAGNLKSDHYKNRIYLSFTNTLNKIEKVYLESINTITNNVKLISIDNHNKHSVYPNITVNKNGIHITWLQQENIFTSARESSGNKYKLYYNKFTHNLESTSHPFKISKAYIKNSNDIPVIKVNNNQVFIVWNIFDNNNKQKILYYTKFNPDIVKNIPVKKLLDSPGQYPDVIMNNGYDIIFTGHDINSLLNIMSIDSIDNYNASSKILFPNFKLSYTPKLFKDTKGNLSLLWIKLEDNKRKLYFAGTQNPETQGFLQTLGIKFNIKDLSPLTIILYFITFPLLPLFNNLIFCLAAAGSVLLLYWLGKKVRFLNFLTKLNNSYLSYILILLFIFIFISLKDAANFLFYPATPPLNTMIYIFIFVSLSGLIFLKINTGDKGKGLPILWGAVAGLIWFYWVAQANLIFYAYKFFY